MDPARCALDCLHGTLAYTTPAYYSLDTPRSVTLLYRSEQAYPRPIVQLTAQDTSADPATAFSIRLKRNFGDQGFETFTNDSSEIFYARHTSGTNRLAAQIRADTLPTGAYGFTAYVTSWWSPEVFRERTVPVTVLVVNERQSPFGLGWSVAGLTALHQSSYATNGTLGVLLTDGTGGARFFTGACGWTTNCAFTSPPGDFSMLRFVFVASPGESYFTRSFQDGTVETYRGDGTLQMVEDRFGARTLFVQDGSGRLSYIEDPAGQAMVLGYDAQGMLDTLQSADGRVSLVDIDPGSISDPTSSSCRGMRPWLSAASIQRPGWSSK